MASNDGSEGLSPDRMSPVSQAMFDEIYGSSLICCQIMLVLYGIASLQTYMFYLNYPKDSIVMKLLVFWMWCLSTVHAAFISHTVYHYLVKSYSKPMSLIDGEWSVYLGTVVGVVICFSIQIFFARMIYLLTKGRMRLLLTAAFAVLISAQVAFGIYFSYNLFDLWELLDLHEAVYRAMVPLFSIRVISDALTAATLCIILYDSSSFSKSSKLVRTLIIYAMNRFVLTTLVVIVQTIVLIVRPNSIWAMVIEFVSAQLYVNSFLATLNSRNHLRRIGNSYSLYPSHSSNRRNSRIRSSETQTNLSAPQFRPPSFESSESSTEVVGLAERSRRSESTKLAGSHGDERNRVASEDDEWIIKQERALYLDNDDHDVEMDEADEGVHGDIEANMDGKTMDFGETMGRREGVKRLETRSIEDGVS